MLPKTIICDDAFNWLKTEKAASIFTSPPDAEEIGADLASWADWFGEAVRLCFEASKGPVAFYVTDRKHRGSLFSKPQIIFREADKAGIKTTWHKICLRRDVGKTDIHRPTFTHLIAFNGKPGIATPDVIKRGKTLYKNGTGLIAARVGVEWIMTHKAKHLVDPFCGQGTIPAVAEALGLSSIGIDIDPDQCAKALECSLVKRW